jgi:3-oxoacyl-[acyl-carrier protein] reductase
MTLALAAAGAKIVGVDLPDSQQEMAQIPRLAKERGFAADRIFTVAGDVTSVNDCVVAVNTAIQQFGALHGLVNNAAVGMQGIGPVLAGKRKKFFEVSAGNWRRAFDVNINGAFNMARAVAPVLIQQGFGRIVNLVTSYVTMQDAGFSPYGPTKAALEAATVIWAKDLESTGVTVNALLPGGPVDTRMIPDSDGIDRSKLLRPVIMGPPIGWLITKAANTISGRRFIAANWDTGVAPDEAALKACALAGWYHNAPMHIRV